MYRVGTSSEADEQIAALPHEALVGYAEALDVLRHVPWNGKPFNEGNPDGAVRQLAFGPSALGLLVYLILDDQDRVDVLEVIWVG